MGNIGDMILAHKSKLVGDQLRVWMLAYRQRRNDLRCDVLGELSAHSEAFRPAVCASRNSLTMPRVPAGSCVVIQVQETTATKVLGTEFQQSITDVVRYPREDAVGDNVVELAGKSIGRCKEIRVDKFDVGCSNADLRASAISIWLCAPSTPTKVACRR